MDSIGRTAPYVGMSPDELRAAAAGYHLACYAHEEPGYCAPQHATWSYEANYDISKLLHLVPEGWEFWFAEEQRELAELRPPGWYEAMLNRPIEEAIIVLERGCQGYIWDGWHRTGATVTRKLTGIPAIVGRTGEDN